MLLNFPQLCTKKFAAKLSKQTGEDHEKWKGKCRNLCWKFETTVKGTENTFPIQEKEEDNFFLLILKCNSSTSNLSLVLICPYLPNFT